MAFDSAARIADVVEVLDVDVRFETARDQLLESAVAALEGALPATVPARRGAGRSGWDVLAPHLAIGDVQPALRAIARALGGELTPTSAGNMSFCSAESSALMAVNFLAPFHARAGLLGLPAGALTFEHEFRVRGVRSPIGPTLDAVLQTPAGSVAIEVKTCEPWRGPPKRSISPQYDTPAAALSPGALATVHAIRTGATGYRCLDAAQMLKHLLGTNHALRDGRLKAPAKLVALYLEPADGGPHSEMFDLLEAELADFARRVSDQPIPVQGISTRDVLARWHIADAAWLRGHATHLSTRYDLTLEHR